MEISILLCHSCAKASESLPVSGTDWTGFVGNLLGAAIGAIVAILIFILSNESQKKKDRETEKRRIAHAKKTYFLQLKNALTAIKKQKDAYDEFIADSQSNALDNALPNELVHSELERLVSTPTHLVLEIFEFSKLTDEDYVSMINNLDYLIVIVNAIRDDMINNKKRSNERLINKFIEIRNELLELCADFILAQKKADVANYLSQPLTKFLSDFTIKYYTNDPGGVVNIKYDYDSLVVPLKDELLNKFQLEDISSHLLKKLKTLGNIKFTLEEHNQGYVNDLTTANDLIKDAIAKIELISVKVNP